VEEFLDWRYEDDVASGLERWLNRTDTHEKEIELQARSGSSFEIRAKSRRLADGVERMRRQLAGTEQTRSAAHGRVRRALANL
jgi:hypothetical protein